MSAHEAAKLPDRYMKLPEVMKMTSLGSTTIYRKMKNGEFPLSRELGQNTVRWRESEVLKWMNERPVAQPSHA